MDYTSLSVFMQKNKGWLGPAVLALLTFIAGWHTGRVMSPYYAAHPIVFEDRQCDECSSSGGSAEELAELKAAGQETTKNKVVTNATPQPAVAAAKSSEVSEATGKFVGSVNSDLYHHPTCTHAKRIKPDNQVWFNSQAEAEAAGYTASKCTRDTLGL